MKPPMRLIFTLSLMLIFACRTSRPLVDILDDRSPSQLAPKSEQNSGFSASTTLILTAVSTSPGELDYDRIDLSIRETVDGGVFLHKNYKLGEAIIIKPHIDYEITVSGYAAAKKLYSIGDCKKKFLKIHTEIGPNKITAALCSLARDP